MKALYFHHSLSLKECPIPTPKSGEALVQVHFAGICNTDLEILKGYMNFSGIPGHEFAGRVVESDNMDLVGKRVTGEINIGCGACAACQEGMARHCPNRDVLGIQNHDGSFAEYLILPEKNLFVLPDSIPDQEAVFVEPLAAALEILEQIQIQPNFQVAVFGDGKLGLLIAQVLKTTGCHPNLIGRHPDKLRLIQRLGIQSFLEQEIPAKKYDVVVDATGSADGFHQSLKYVKPRGVFVLKSTTHEPIQFNPAKLVIDEIQLVGSRCGPFGPAIRLLEEKRVDVKSFISGIYPLTAWEKAFQEAESGESLKVLLSMTS